MRGKQVWELWSEEIIHNGPALVTRQKWATNSSEFSRASEPFYKKAQGEALDMQLGDWITLIVVAFIVALFVWGEVQQAQESEGAREPRERGRGAREGVEEREERCEQWMTGML